MNSEMRKSRSQMETDLYEQPYRPKSKVERLIEKDLIRQKMEKYNERHKSEEYQTFFKVFEGMPKNGEVDYKMVHSLNRFDGSNTLHYYDDGMRIKHASAQYQELATERFYKPLFLRLYNYHEKEGDEEYYISDSDYGLEICESKEEWDHDLKRLERVSKEIDEWNKNVKAFIKVLKKRGSKKIVDK